MDDDDYEDGPDTFVHYSLDVSMCRLIGKLLLPTKMNLKLGIELLSDDDEEINFAMLKIQHWMDNHVARCIAVSCQNADGFALLLDENNSPRLDNTLMITATEPTDHHLMFIFQSKINAIAGGAFEVMTIEISSSDGQGMTFTYVGDGIGQLPEMDEWIPGPNWFTKPWWNRDDISMIDTVAPEGADLTACPKWATPMDFLRPNRNDEEALVISWEPRIIEGEKKK